MTGRAPWLDAVSLAPSAATWIELWDGTTALGWVWGAMPVFRFRFAPAGLATRRQLRALRLAPGGHEPYAGLTWRRGQAWAWLYRLDLAVPSRPASPAQLNALDKAMTQRRRCRACREVQSYCVPVSDGRCSECMTGHTPADALAGGGMTPTSRAGRRVVLRARNGQPRRCESCARQRTTRRLDVGGVLFAICETCAPGSLRAIVPAGSEAA
jgi:hypothetical protein